MGVESVKSSIVIFLGSQFFIPSVSFGQENQKQGQLSLVHEANNWRNVGKFVFHV